MGKGSRFTAQIPFGSSHLPADQIKIRSADDTSSDIKRNTYTKNATWWLPTVERDTDLIPRGTQQVSHVTEILTKFLRKVGPGGGSET